MPEMGGSKLIEVSSTALLQLCYYFALRMLSLSLSFFLPSHMVFIISHDSKITMASMPDTSHFNHSVPGLVAFTIVGVILSVLSLALRFWSRMVSPGVLLGYA